jgi:serine/threonine-protein kinase
VKLADFGIARATSRLDLTDPGTIKGKLAYMAPEQARGAPLDARADLFALGVVLWELCAGRRLFARESEAATLAALLEPGAIGPPSAWNEAVPPALDAIILGALERDPARRVESAEALRMALAGLWLELARDDPEHDLRGLMQRLWPDGDLPAVAAEPTALRPTPAPRTPSPPPAEAATRLAPASRRRRALLVVLALAAALSAWGWHRLALRPEAAGAAPQAAGSLPPGGEPPLAGHGLWKLAGEDPELAGRGEGLVRVHVVPWAVVRVDGVAVGETPQELKLKAGGHLLRVEHPALGGAELELAIEPGSRQLWRPALKR